MSRNHRKPHVITGRLAKTITFRSRPSRRPLAFYLYRTTNSGVLSLLTIPENDHMNFNSKCCTSLLENNIPIKPD